ncbi:hypothetical protein OUZ56_026240 [Daphnia magna]|uniref:Uncharacterized protein n=1 Tax=Daphnia magna TaxID=35525 RepID=A0ABQ9ZLN3_9CRUS|nr:hypothetical protein OUZ56_026240 [Daphnia magna]
MKKFTPLKSGGGSTSILRNNENLGVELDSDSPHQSDMDLLDSNEIKELRNDDQWNEYLLRSEKKVELTNKEVGTALRALLLTEPTILTPIELFKHCGLKSYYESTDSDVPIKIVRAEIHTQGDQIPLDCPKLTPSTTTITCPAVNHSESSMNTQTPQSQLASTPCNYLPYQGLESRKVSFTPASIVEQSNKIMQNKPSEETNQDMSIKIYVKELSRLIESGMDYEDASKAADCIVQHILTNTKHYMIPLRKRSIMDSLFTELALSLHILPQPLFIHNHLR